MARGRRADPAGSALTATELREVHEEFITRRDDLVIRRLVLAAGEPMRWHTDVCDRFTVVVRGEQLTIEFHAAIANER